MAARPAHGSWMAFWGSITRVKASSVHRLAKRKGVVAWPGDILGSWTLTDANGRLISDPDTRSFDFTADTALRLLERLPDVE